MPASQSEQEVLRPELNFPASQKEQLDAREPGLYVPAGQFLHVREETAPRVVEKVPESHPVHAALVCSPDPVKYEPARQWRQVPEEMAPREVE